MAAAPSQDPPLLPVVPGQVAEKAEKMGESSPHSANRDGNKSVRFLVNKTQGERRLHFCFFGGTREILVSRGSCSFFFGGGRLRVEVEYTQSQVELFILCYPSLSPRQRTALLESWDYLYRFTIQEVLPQRTFFPALLTFQKTQQHRNQSPNLQQVGTTYK